MNLVTKLGLAASITMAATSAQSATVYAALPTVSEANVGYVTNLWFERPLLDGSNLDFTFRPGATMVLEDADSTGATNGTDGTGTLTGSAQANDDASSGFNVVVNLDEAAVPDNVVFKSLFGAVEPTNNFYSAITTGTLVGFGDFAGLSMTIEAFMEEEGAAAQFGGGLTDDIASNQHNRNFGMSLWFEVSDVAFGANCTFCANNPLVTATDLQGMQGDFVVDLAPVPVPAAGLLMLTALAGVGLARRRG